MRMWRNCDGAKHLGKQGSPCDCRLRWIQVPVKDVFGYTPHTTLYADVAELADALDSGSSESNFIWVQVPSSAPTKREKVGS